ncbi:Hint domain-containing protein [Roseovarius salinarum]|uniref:Hint domain-containing protein n=1 Tax=Roseovarius salinarum TaxID=1981892 RepID=UPI000C33F578|nr:Hint domain-containing protein [Roseovarius salinarum]
MGFPVIGGDITGTVTEGSGDLVTGDLDDVLQPDNPDDTWSITSGASYGTASIDPATGEWSYDLDDSHPAVKALDPGETLTDTFTVLAEDAGGGTDTQQVTITIRGAVCFAAGTLIETETGPRPVESLAAGDRVRTMDNGLQTLRWIGAMPVSTAEMAADPRLAPVRIRAGALGRGLPARDLRVSRQHRVFVRAPQAREAFGSAEALIPAIKLTALPGVRVETAPRAVVYYHLLFDRHEIVFSEGAPTESLLTAPQALNSLPPAARAEIMALFPALGHPGYAARPARTVAETGKKVRAFVDALVRNDAVPLQAA